MEERYKDHAGYVNAVMKSGNDLVKEGFMLPEDAQQINAAAEISDVLKN